MNPIVIVEKLTDSSSSLKNQFNRSFSELYLAENFGKARAIFIKPNLTYPSYKKGVTTRKEFIESLVAALRQINSTTKIYIGEGEAGYNSFSMTDALSVMGFYDIEKKYPNVKIVNLSQLPSQEVELKAKGKPYPIKLPLLLLDEVDFSITCPLPKLHGMTKVTLSFKNQWGCVPDIMRLKNHYVFHEIISQICDRLKFRYAFLDGKYGLDKNGPIIGNPVEVNWFVASNSLGAFDMIVARMMGFDWKTVIHIKMAKKNGFAPREEDIDIIGEPKALERKFVLKRDFWNYPALAAFYSHKLTYLLYFSSLSKILHDIMYTFRERPISN
ncbi:MAG: DUF362 domain-containing protein [bacterium]